MQNCEWGFVYKYEKAMREKDPVLVPLIGADD